MSRLYRGCVVSALVGLAVTVLVMVQLGFRNRTSYTKAFALAEHTHKVLEALRGVRIEIDHVEAGLRAGLVVKAREDAERSRSVALKMTLLTADHPSQHALAQRVVGAADALSLAIVAHPETVAGHVERIRRERIA